MYINAFLASYVEILSDYNMRLTGLWYRLNGRDELRDKSTGIVSIPLSTIPRPVFLEVQDNNTVRGNIPNPRTQCLHRSCYSTAFCPQIYNWELELGRR